MGQGPADGQFVARGDGYSLALSPTVMAVSLTGSSATGTHPTGIRMNLLGGNGAAAADPQDPTGAKTNYIIGNNPADWHTEIATYQQVVYRNVYPGIDIAYHSNQNQLEYDFVVAPGASPASIGLAFDGVSGERLSHGDLVLTTSAGDLVEHAPVVYQTIAGVRTPVAGQFVQRPGRIGFAVAPYDLSQPLVIDPTLLYSTYLGGSGADNPDQDRDGIAVDSTGAAYVTGLSSSVNFPTTAGAFDTSLVGGRDAFVTKMKPDGSGIVYSTYFGGGNEAGGAIAVDAAGDAFITGFSGSGKLRITAGDFRTTPAGAYDSFASELSPSGSSLVYSTYLGGSGNEVGPRTHGIAVDSTGKIYVSGSTDSVDFPTTANAFQPKFGGGSDSWMVKIDPTLPGDGSGKVSPTDQQLVYSLPPSARGLPGGAEPVRIRPHRPRPRRGWTLAAVAGRALRVARVDVQVRGQEARVRRVPRQWGRSG